MRYLKSYVNATSGGVKWAVLSLPPESTLISVSFCSKTPFNHEQPTKAVHEPPNLIINNFGAKSLKVLFIISEAKPMIPQGASTRLSARIITSVFFLYERQ